MMPLRWGCLSFVSAPWVLGLGSLGSHGCFLFCFSLGLLRVVYSVDGLVGFAIDGLDLFAVLIGAGMFVLCWAACRGVAVGVLWLVSRYG